MVQNKQKSNKINITALITCFMLIVVFVFGCVQYAFAASAKYTVAEIVESCNVEHGAYVGYTYDFSGSTVSSIFSVASSTGKMCAYYYQTDSQTFVGLLSDEPFDAYQFNGFKRNTLWHVNKQQSDGLYGVGSVSSKFNIFEFQTQLLTFSTKEDAVAYLTNGEINNPIYDNRPIEYDESVELPLSAQCQVNGDLFLFNCKQSVAHSDYTIQLSADCRLTPVYSNFASKSYADTKQSYRTNKNEIGKYDNHDVSFNTSFSTSDLLKGVDTSRKALGFKEFYNGIYINLPYEKCTLSEIVFYARNICGNKCSNWVRVTYDLVNETSKYEEVESVTGSDTPSNTKHNNSEYYPDDYLYNDDEAFNSGSNITNTLTNLKDNYTNLVSFFKNLFSFLPSEVWVLLVGLVGVMVVIALLKFIRG